MGIQTTGVHNHDGQQHIEMLRLQCHERYCEDVHGDEHLEDHPRAYLVEIAVAQIMERSDYHGHGNDTRRQQPVVVNHRVVAQRLELRQGGEVGNKLVNPVLPCVYAGDKPVWSYDADNGSPEHPVVQRHQIHPHHQPEEGHEIENLHEEDTCHSDACEGIEHHSRRPLVLIAPQQRDIEQHEEHLHRNCLRIPEQERCGASHGDERARHHPAVNPYQCIGVVQRHHHQRGNGKDAQLEVQRTAHQSRHHPHHDGVDHGNGEREAAFGHPILQSFPYHLQVLSDIPSEVFVCEIDFSGFGEGFPQGLLLVLAV